MSTPIAIGRRSFLGRAAAVLAGASATTPVMLTAALAAPEEDPLLVDAGRRLGGLVDAFAAAQAKLAEAKALARSLVPDVPEEIVCYSSTFWAGCSYELRDVDDSPLPGGFVVDSDGYSRAARPKKIIDSTSLKNLIKDGVIHCDGRTSFGKAVKRKIALAERYESDRAAAIERSGLPEAYEAAFFASQAIDDLAREVAAIEPKTSAGVAVLARVLCAYVETEEYSGNRHHGAMILGKPLAEAVARLA
ncbi:hypothetical protein J4G43_004935 [Bradyrhizobium barranii subsp. barranii]|uniref:Uncharacterized protein n=1 Tax=Bradyrhizobium barranii subsp. barranii TaxID=2823807 RepID=A0A939RZ51_9BRAD|nr:hypothetical protein [Bradyrhizobium barranii]UEM13669.1 hypothetical protein J4G43_004935 [Bradyrhizobium barranii subsp. barranii]